MNIEEVSRKVAEIDDLEKWIKAIPVHFIEQRKEIFSAAEPIWLVRKIKNNDLLFYSDLTRELQRNNFQPSDLHKKLVWASFLATSTEKYSKKQFYRLKDKISKKHGIDWWEDVYQLIRSMFAARKQIENEQIKNGETIQFMARHTLTFAHAFHEQRDHILKKCLSRKIQKINQQYT